MLDFPSAPTPERKPLTIDTQGLRDVWLPSFRQDARTVEVLADLRRKARSAKAEDALLHGLVAVTVRWRETVEMIVRRGGLLLCVDQRA